MTLRQALLAGLLGAVSAGPAETAETAPRRLLAAHEQAAFRGVGRLDLGDGYCTATLHSPTRALTAAHCLVDASGALRPTAAMRFRAGLRGNGQQAVRGVRRAALHPDWRLGGRAPTMAEIATDLALIELDQPLLTTDFPSYTPGATPPPGGAVALLSYGRGRDHALSLQDPCRILARRGGAVQLTCEAAPGTSGSPVLARVDGRLRLVGVISAAGRGTSWAADASSALPALEAALDRAGPRRAVSRPGDGLGRGGGWKTSRPPPPPG